MKKLLRTSAIASFLALGVSGVSHAQDFLAPLQLKIDALQQQQKDEQTKYDAQKAQTETNVTSSTGENASSTDIKMLVEKKLGKTLDADRVQVATDFENAIAKLNDLIGRISSRMTKMQTAGMDISSSTALSDEAHANISAAANNVTVLESLLGKQTTISTRKNILSQIKTQSDLTKKSIETAYRSIMDLIKELKQESESAASANTASSSQDQSTTTSAVGTSTEE